MNARRLAFLSLCFAFTVPALITGLFLDRYIGQNVGLETAFVSGGAAAVTALFLGIAAVARSHRREPGAEAALVALITGLAMVVLVVWFFSWLVSHAGD